MTIKLPDDLPNQTAAMEKAAKAEAFFENAKEMTKFNQFMDNCIKDGMTRYQNQYPDAAKKVGYTYQGHAYVKKPGSQVILTDIMRQVAFPGGLEKTKAEIMSTVRTDRPKHSDSINYNVWYRPLKAAQFKKMQGIIAMNHARRVSIRGCKTLDEIRDRLIAESIKSAAKVSTKVTITIDKTSVVIGEKVYSISVRKSKGKEYPSIRVGKKRVLINVNALREALHESQ